MRINVNLTHIFIFDIRSSCTYLFFKSNIHVSVIITFSQTRSLTNLTNIQFAQRACDRLVDRAINHEHVIDLKNMQIEQEITS